MGFKTFVTGGVLGFMAGVTAAAVALTEENEIQVGDRVNWESDGVLRFKTGKIVNKITDSEEYGKFVFVEGTQTGIPYDECIKVNFDE